MVLLVPKPPTFLDCEDVLRYTTPIGVRAISQVLYISKASMRLIWFDPDLSGSNC